SVAALGVGRESKGPTGEETRQRPGPLINAERSTLNAQRRAARRASRPRLRLPTPNDQRAVLAAFRRVGRRFVVGVLLAGTPVRADDVSQRDGDVEDAVLVDVGQADAPGALLASLRQPGRCPRRPFAGAVAEVRVHAVDAADFVQRLLADHHHVGFAVVVEIADRHTERVHRQEALVGEFPTAIRLLQIGLDTTPGADRRTRYPAA